MGPPSPSRSSSPDAPASKASASAGSATSGLSARRAKATKAGLLALLLLTSAFQGGCYLTHLAWGQVRLLSARQSIESVLADPETPPELRAKLELVEAARAYADALGLSVDHNYTSYVEWPGDRMVTTVVAARPGEVEPAGFWFPLVGRLPYKGFFDEERAEREAEKLRGEGLDVCVVAVPAYSTLGWFADPVTAPMLRAGDGRLVETLLHELVHATVFVREQVDFNEGVASFIGEEASVGFFAARSDAEAEARRREIARARRLDDEMMALRSRVEDLYADQPEGAERAAQRARYEAEARRRIESLVGGDPTLAERVRLNDACLALAATYTADIPRYAALLERFDGDLRAFVARLREVSKADDPRAALLGEEAP